MPSGPEILDQSFFRRDPESCARDLIGCVFSWDGCAGEIVETEAYAAEGDEACHTHFRPSARRFIADHEPGTAYVYLNYGVHWLFNLLVKGDLGAGFVLFRALEPLAGLDLMRSRRKKAKREELCSGPGKLTQALGINCDVHGREVLREATICGIRRNHFPVELTACKRVGISRAKDRPWRFLRTGAPSVSVPPR